MSSTITNPENHKLTLRVDATRRKAQLVVDDVSFPFKPLGAESGLTEFTPEFFISVCDGIRFYPTRKLWQPTVKHLGCLLTRYLSLNLDSFEGNRQLFLKKNPAANISIVIEGTPNTIALPFEVLLDGSEQRPLIVDHPFSRRVSPPRTKPHPGYLDLADTELKGLRVLIVKASVEGKVEIPEDGHMSTYSLGRLKGVETEVSELQRIFPDAEIIASKKGQAATKEELATQLKKDRWDVVHFAGHGLYVDEDFSGIILSKTGKDTDPVVIESNELASLFEESPSVKFVYLSSCEGATTGVTPSETLYSNFDGVVRGLLTGGVGTVLAHRWPISDQIAGTMAKHFYEGFIRGFALESALQHARRKVFESHEKENAWASSVLVFAV